MSARVWERRPLGAVADLCLGKMLDQKKNRGEPLPYLANVNVRWGEFVLDNLRTMRFEPKEFERYGLKFGDIVMCEGGEPGRCAIWKNQTSQMMIQKALHRIRPKETLDYRFLFYNLLHLGQTKAFDQYFTGSTIKHLPGEKLAKVEVVVPPSPVQRRIAAILSAYDDLIENNTRRIAILEEMARRIYEEWFVRFRFPGHDEVKRVESELGLIPEGWRVGSLGEAAAINARSIRPADAPLEILYIDIASVVPGAITQKQPYRFSEAPGRARRVVRHGDVIWSCVRPNRRSYALILQPEPALIASTGFAVLSAKSVPYSYLYFAVTTDDFVGFLTNHATGAAYPAVTASTFEAAPFLIPEEEVADQFHAVVAPMLDLSETLKRKNANLRVTRDLLLPKLISGELDVSTLSEPTV